MNLADVIRECADDVHTELGPYLRENAYQEALKVALSDEGIQFTSEATIPVMYRDFPVARMHPDLIVGDSDRYVLELKVDRDGSDQLATYLDYADRNGMDSISGGYMISFGTDLEVVEL